WWRGASTATTTAAIDLSSSTEASSAVQRTCGCWRRCSASTCSSRSQTAARRQPSSWLNTRTRFRPQPPAPTTAMVNGLFDTAGELSRKVKPLKQGVDFGAGGAAAAAEVAALERGGGVREAQRVAERAPVEERAQERGVEHVAARGGVDHLDGKSRRQQQVLAVERRRAARAEGAA